VVINYSSGPYRVLSDNLLSEKPGKSLFTPNPDKPELNIEDLWYRFRLRLRLRPDRSLCLFYFKSIELLNYSIWLLFGILNFGHCVLFGICEFLFDIFLMLTPDT
jgi:hypothetical protein